MTKNKLFAILLSLAILSSCGDKKEPESDLSEPQAKVENSEVQNNVNENKTSNEILGSSVVSDWIEGKATINVVSENEGEFSYTITYDIPGSTGTDSSGNKFKGPIVQHSLSKLKPVDGQTVDILYLKNDPIMFKYKSQIKFEEVKK